MPMRVGDLLGLASVRPVSGSTNTGDDLLGRGVRHFLDVHARPSLMR
jgi:hypothetical protein